MLAPNNQTLTVSDLVSTVVPWGWQTVPGWWAEQEADALGLLAEPLATFEADADKLKQDGVPVVWTDAPPLYQSAGHNRVRAIPLASLYEMYRARS